MSIHWELLFERVIGRRCKMRNGQPCTRSPPWMHEWIMTLDFVINSLIQFHGMGTSATHTHINSYSPESERRVTLSSSDFFFLSSFSVNRNDWVYAIKFMFFFFACFDELRPRKKTMKNVCTYIGMQWTNKLVSKIDDWMWISWRHSYFW